MKRSIIAAAAILLLLSSTTYAMPRRARQRVQRARFWSVMLCWLGHSHHHGYERCAPRHEYGSLPRGHRGRPQYGWGWHFGWDKGRREGWDRHDSDRGDRRGSGRPREDEHGNGRGGGRGRG